MQGGKLKIQGNMGLAMKLDKIPKAPSGNAASPAPAAQAPAASGASGFRAQAVFDVRYLLFKLFFVEIFSVRNSLRN